MFRFVEIAVGDVWEMLEAGDREQVVTVGRLPHVDKPGELVAIVREPRPPKRALIRKSALRSGWRGEDDGEAVF